MRKLSSLATERANQRRAASNNRRALRHKINGYNPLSNKNRALPGDFKYDSARAESAHDIILHAEELMRPFSKKNVAARKSAADRIVDSVISPEIRSYWKERITAGGVKL